MQSGARNAKEAPESAICGVLRTRPAPTGSVNLLVPVSNPRSAPRRAGGRTNLRSDACCEPLLREMAPNSSPASPGGIWEGRGQLAPPLAGFPGHKSLSGAARRQPPTAAALHSRSRQEDRITRGRSPCGWGNPIVPARSRAVLGCGGNIHSHEATPFRARSNWACEQGSLKATLKPGEPNRP